MDHVLAQQGLRLTYLCDPRAIGELDQDRILEDLSDNTPDGDPLPHFAALTDCDHLVLVTDRSSGRHIGFLPANNGSTEREDFLLLTSAFVATTARGQNLTRRMLALMLLRISGMAPVPSVITARLRNPLYYRIMRGIARRFAAAAFFPNPDSATIDFHTATLAQRIARAIDPSHRFNAMTGTMRGGYASSAGVPRPLSFDPQIDRLFGPGLPPTDRMLAVIDLRASYEAAILDDARRIYRSR